VLRCARETLMEAALRPGSKHSDVPRTRCSAQRCTAEPGPAQARLL